MMEPIYWNVFGNVKILEDGRLFTSNVTAAIGPVTPKQMEVAYYQMSRYIVQFDRHDYLIAYIYGLEYLVDNSQEVTTRVAAAMALIKVRRKHYLSACQLVCYSKSSPLGFKKLYMPWSNKLPLVYSYIVAKKWLPREMWKMVVEKVNIKHDGLVDVVL